LGEIRLGGAQDPFPHFEAFPAGFVGTGWDTGSCDLLTGTTSLGTSCGLQTLDKNETISTGVKMRQQETVCAYQ
jgi:hypothetical protein